MPEDNGTFDRVLYMGLYMAVIPIRGEVEAEKKRFCGHGGEDSGGMVGVVRGWCGVVVVSVVFHGCNLMSLQPCNVASIATFKAYLCTCFVGV